MKKRFIRFAAGALAVALIAGTWAYYSSQNKVDNQLKTKEYGSTLKEEFTPKDDWQPGEEVDKKVAVKNTGDYKLVARVKLEEKWTRDGNTIASITPTDAAGMTDITTVSQTSATDGAVTGDKTVVEKTLAAAGWTKGTDGYWYYNTVLDPGASTSELLSKIKLAADADMGKYNVTNYYFEGTAEPAYEPEGSHITTDATTGWKVYTGAVPSPATKTNKIFTRTVSVLDPNASGYAGAVYDLIVTAETCQASSAAVAATWTTAPGAVVTGWALQ